MDMVSKQNTQPNLPHNYLSFSSHGYGIKTKHFFKMFKSNFRFSSHGYGIKTKPLTSFFINLFCFSSHGYGIKTKRL